MRGTAELPLQTAIQRLAPAFYPPCHYVLHCQQQRLAAAPVQRLHIHSVIHLLGLDSGPGAVHLEEAAVATSTYV
jgi:hypothetical protein